MQRMFMGRTAHAPASSCLRHISFHSLCLLQSGTETVVAKTITTETRSCCSSNDSPPEPTDSCFRASLSLEIWLANPVQVGRYLSEEERNLLKTAGCKPRPQLPRDDERRAETGSSEDPEGRGSALSGQRTMLKGCWLRLFPGVSHEAEQFTFWLKSLKCLLSGSLQKFANP